LILIGFPAQNGRNIAACKGASSGSLSGLDVVNRIADEKCKGSVMICKLYKFQEEQRKVVPNAGIIVLKFKF
jgi:hypothetical protein